MDITLVHMAAQPALDMISMAHTALPDPSSVIGGDVGHHVMALDPQQHVMALDPQHHILAQETGTVDLSGDNIKPGDHMGIQLSSGQINFFRKIAGILAIIWVLFMGLKLGMPGNKGGSMVQRMGGWQTIIGGALAILVLFNIQRFLTLLGIIWWALGWALDWVSAALKVGG